MCTYLDVSFASPIGISTFDVWISRICMCVFVSCFFGLWQSLKTFYTFLLMYRIFSTPQVRITVCLPTSHTNISVYGSSCPQLCFLLVPVKQLAESSPEHLNCSLLLLLYSFPNTCSCKNRTPLNKRLNHSKKHFLTNCMLLL